MYQRHSFSANLKDVFLEELSALRANGTNFSGDGGSSRSSSGGKELCVLPAAHSSADVLLFEHIMDLTVAEYVLGGLVPLHSAGAANADVKVKVDSDKDKRAAELPSHPSSRSHSHSVPDTKPALVMDSDMSASVDSDSAGGLSNEEGSEDFKCVFQRTFLRAVLRPPVPAPTPDTTPVG